MSNKNSIITVEQQFHPPGGNNNPTYTYKVLKLQNRTSPKIGDVLTEIRLKELMVDRLTTVKIVGPSH